MITMQQKATRLAHLRSSNNMTQKEMAERLSELSTRKEPLTVSTVSSWETGRRQPSREMVDCIAKLFQVSADYLECLTDDPNGSADSLLPEPEYENQIAISMDKIPTLDGKPVFVSFKNHAHEDQWGIVNISRNSFILRDGLLRFSDQTIDQIFVSEPYFAYIKSTQNNLSLDMSKLLSVKRYVWIEMITSNSYIRGLYDGWYHHNETHTCLINNKGLTLPYEGLGVSFHAYPNRKMC